MNFKNGEQTYKYCRANNNGIYLKHLRLKFSQQQLQQLNGYFADLETNKGGVNNNRNSIAIQVYIEKLLLRLNYIIASLDSKFLSTFLIRLDSRIFENSTTFSYFIRLDELSSPSVHNPANKPSCRVVELDDNLQGFGKIQLSGATVEKWIHFVNNDGYLRTDKVLRRYVELLKLAIKVVCDENKKTKDDVYLHCSPSLVVDANTLHHILKTPPEQRLFYALPSSKNEGTTGDGSSNGVETIRLNAVFREDTTSSVRLHIRWPADVTSLIGENVPNSDIILKLYLAINFEGLPFTSDYPVRIPLFDTHILLHQQAATTGFYMVVSKPPQSAYEDDSALWRFQFPAIEDLLTTHYSSFSVIARVVNIVKDLTTNVRTVSGCSVVGGYIVKTFVWFQLENIPEPSFWTSPFLAYHTLRLLNDLIASLRNVRSSRSFFFPNFDLIKYSKMTSSRGDYATTDVDTLEEFVRRAYTISSELIGYRTIGNGRCRYQSYLLKYENALLDQWNRVLNDFVGRNRKSAKKNVDRVGRCSRSIDDCSEQQLKYIVQVMRGLLFVHSVKSINIEEINENSRHVIDIDYLLRFPLIYNHYLVEYIMYVISIMIRQAVDIYSTERNCRLVRWRYRQIIRRSSSDRKRKSFYRKAVSSFLENIKTTVKDDMLVRDIVDDAEFARYILKTLLFKIGQNKFMRRVLKPYVDDLILSSYENCWFLNDWKSKVENDELKSLRVFARLLYERKISPRYGLIDALCKGWQWPVRVVKCMIKLNCRRLILFSRIDGVTVTSYCLTFNVEEMRNLEYQLINNNSTFNKRGNYENRYLFNIFNPYYFDENNDQDEISYKNNDLYAWYTLSNASPITAIIDGQRRYGVHKYLGNVMDGLILLNKFSILQELSSLLPKEQRKQALEDIRLICREKYRKRKNVVSKSVGSYEDKLRRCNNSSNGDVFLSDNRNGYLKSYKNLIVEHQVSNRIDTQVRRRKKSLITIMSTAAAATPSLLEIPYEQQHDAMLSDYFC